MLENLVGLLPEIGIALGQTALMLAIGLSSAGRWACCSSC